jgi:hypothetical protein
MHETRDIRQLLQTVAPSGTVRPDVHLVNFQYSLVIIFSRFVTKRGGTNSIHTTDASQNGAACDTHGTFVTKGSVSQQEKSTVVYRSVYLMFFDEL